VSTTNINLVWLVFVSKNHYCRHWKDPTNFTRGY